MVGPKVFRIAVVGMGPRALGALEALVQRLDGFARVAVDVFDPLDLPGAGPNFAPTQDRLCLLNLPLRSIDLGAAPDAAFPDFAAWLGPGRDDPERFPARAELGGYFIARFRALQASAAFPIRVHALAAQRLDHDAADGWWLRSGDTRHGPFAEVLLTQGQPATAPDAQLARWTEHAARTGADLLPAYPSDALARAADGWAGKTVAIRGLGLSTLDVLRVLTLGQGGEIRDGGYLRSGREPARIVPFSLDGMPPWPKPACAARDAQFDPTSDETEAFSAGLIAALHAGPDQVLPRLCELLVPACQRILDGDPADIRAWLAVERDRPGAQDSRDPATVLRHAIAMSQGTAPPDIGYVLGQLWRKWQNRLRRAFNPAPPDPTTAAAVLGFDEGMKRYSYGPPLASAQELLALIDAGLVDLRAADDPSVQVIAQGWQLHEGKATLKAQVMIDAVLPAPDIASLTDPLPAGLRDQGRIRARDDKLALAIRPDGQSLGRDGVQPGLSILGRMALGSVIATDSIHDCFGAASHRWARAVADRAKA